MPGQPSPAQVTEVRCRCGKVALAAQGRPILTSVCHCADCQAAGRLLEARAGAAPILDATGGVAYVLFRKDRVHCLRGREQLREHRLTAGTPTRRVVATCCNSFMFAEFTKGHWLSVVRDRIADGPAIARAPAEETKSVTFLLRLIAAWARMGFRRPRIDYVQGALEDP